MPFISNKEKLDRLKYFINFKNNEISNQKMPYSALHPNYDNGGYASENYTNILYHSDNPKLINSIFNTKFNDDDLGLMLYFAFNHEITHSLNYESMTKKDINYNEHLADAFAAIRTIQRYKEEGANIVKKFLHIRLGELINSTPDIEHYTCPSIQEVLDINDKTDLNKLSLKETMNLALQIADNNRITLYEQLKITSSINKISEVKEKALFEGLKTKWLENQLDKKKELQLPETVTRFLNNGSEESSKIRKALYSI